MARLIDANEITYYTDEQGFECAYKVDIDNLPTIDPESLRPTAHWMSDSLYVAGKRKLLQWCSLCNCPGLRKTKYCPHCGAKMEDESNET